MSKKKSCHCHCCKKWAKAAVQVVKKYDALGFRHDAERAKGAEQVLNMMGKTAHNPNPHTIVQVSGVTPVIDGGYYL